MPPTHSLNCRLDNGVQPLVIRESGALSPLGISRPDNGKRAGARIDRRVRYRHVRPIEDDIVGIGHHRIGTIQIVQITARGEIAVHELEQGCPIQQFQMVGIQIVRHVCGNSHAHEPAIVRRSAIHDREQQFQVFAKKEMDMIELLFR